MSDALGSKSEVPRAQIAGHESVCHQLAGEGLCRQSRAMKDFDGDAARLVRPNESRDASGLGLLVGAGIDRMTSGPHVRRELVHDLLALDLEAKRDQVIGGTTPQKDPRGALVRAIGHEFASERFASLHSDHPG